MNSKIEFVVAEHSDLDQVQRILSEAARWMRTERGVLNQWPERFPDWVVAEAIDAREMYLVRVGSAVVGTVRIQDADPGTWGDDDEPAVYVHSLAVRREEAGKGLGGAILDKVQADAALSGRPRLRLDCLASNDDLRRFYERHGFSHRGDVEQHIGHLAWLSSRYERHAANDVVESSTK